MIVTIDIEEKSINHKLLFQDLKLTFGDNEKIAIIGRNGVGKTTLFRMLNSEDRDYNGSITFRSGLRVVATRQEHHDLESQTVLDYITTNLPDYARLKHIIDTYPETMGDNMRKIHQYSEALERFNDFDYYNVEDRIRRSLDDYQLEGAAERPMSSLSGGQKRFVELIRVEHSHANLALIDEPTNHMDYVAKAAFLEWFKAVDHSVVVITHDRDLLHHVDRIIEIKDYQAENFPGNYDAYLKQNTMRTATDLNDYETVLRRIVKVKKQIQYAISRKPSWHGRADQKNPFVVMEERLRRELKDLEAQEKPSFWIDQESISDLRPKLEESYHKHKAKTIRIRRVTDDERQRNLVTLDNVQVGYDSPLFAPLKLQIQTGDRLRIVGRNGAGKTTLVKTILACQESPRPTTLLHGKITLDAKLRISTYEQEMSPELLNMTLAEAIEHIYDSLGLPVNAEQIMRVLSDYLFDPYGDREQMVTSLSGGQKSRLQLIKLFASNPNLIVLDEPTNHLDLPSIEELEAALKQYRGAILYISHDSYFARNLGGKQLVVKAL